MKQYTVTPLIGFGNIQFGMLRNEVRNMLGMPVCEFKKSKFSKATTDDYGEFHVFYTADDRFEAVEFFDEVRIQDNMGNVFPESADALVQLPYSFSEEYGSYISQEHSIGIYAPDQRVESILFAAKGYYN